MQGINSYIKKNQKRIVFADGEDKNTLKAAIAFKNSKLGVPILVGKKEKIKERIKEIGYDDHCLLYTSPSPRDAHESRMPSSA